MLSCASSGSVSDATKKTPSFTVSNIIIQKVGPGGPLGQPVTLSNTDTIEVRLQDVVAFEPILVTLVTSTSGNGGRATNNPHGYASDHMITGIDDPGPSLQYTDPQSISGNPDTQVGQFSPPGADGSGGVSTESAIIDPNTQILGGATDVAVFPQTLVLENPEVQHGVITSATGQFRLLDDKIEIIDLNTGVIATGPSDAFNFKVKITQ